MWETRHVRVRDDILEPCIHLHYALKCSLHLRHLKDALFVLLPAESCGSLVNIEAMHTYLSRTLRNFKVSYGL